MPVSHLEREDKFDADPAFELPGLGAADERIVEVRNARRQLRSRYFDTADRALLTAGMTLRHRTGEADEADEGWQLKVPKSAAREELRTAGDIEAIPEELLTLLRGVRRDQPLELIATLETTRLVTELLDADGVLLAEVADDTVTASVDGLEPTSWREVEVELGPAGDEELLSRVAEELRRAGARRSASRSKLARGLGVVEVRADDDLLQHYLLAQQRAMLAGDLALRRGDDSVIHPTRVAIRRLRSTLRTFLDREAGRALDDELRWLAGILGEVRDCQVMRKRLLRLVDELADSEVLGPVRTRIKVELDREQAEAWRRVQQVLVSERYLQLLSAVNAFRLTVHRIPAKRLVKLMARAEAKVVRRLAGAAASPTELHRARKAAKRARYAGELVSAAADQHAGGLRPGGKRSARRRAGIKQALKQTARNEARQDHLGEHQDSVVTAQLLLRLGQIAGTTPAENGFTFGLLYERERQRAAAVREGLA